MLSSRVHSTVQSPPSRPVVASEACLLRGKSALQHELSFHIQVYGTYQYHIT